MWAAAEAIEVSGDQRRVLETWVRAHGTPQSIVARSKSILMAAEGIPNRQIAAQLGVSRPTVIWWRTRFTKGGTAALTEVERGRGRRPEISTEKVKAIIDATLHTKPKGQTHWSCRTMAKAQHDLRGLPSVAPRSYLQVPIRRPEAEVPEEHVRHLEVVVLTCVHHGLPDTVALGERGIDGCQLHEIRSRAHDVEDVHRHG